MKDAYAKECERLDTLAKAMVFVSEEFLKSKDTEVAAAGHVLSSLIIRQIEALDRELDLLIEKAGI